MSLQFFTERLAAVTLSAQRSSVSLFTFRHTFSSMCLSSRPRWRYRVEKVRELREGRGWNQTELAFHAGLAPSVISQIENGKRNPSASTLKKLAGALEVGVGELFSGKAQASLFEADGQRRDPVLNTIASSLRKLAKEWKYAVPSHKELRARPQLALDFLSRNEAVQADASVLLAAVEGVREDFPRAVRDLPQEVGKELAYAHYEMAVALEKWQDAAIVAMEVADGVTELRPDLGLIAGGLERGEQNRRQYGPVLEEHRRAS